MWLDLWLNICNELKCVFSSSVHLISGVVVGSGTEIIGGTIISQSVIGSDCHIGMLMICEYTLGMVVLTFIMVVCQLLKQYIYIYIHIVEKHTGHQFYHIANESPV